MTAGAGGIQTFDSQDWPAGGYETALLDTSGDVQATSTIWLAEPGAGPSLRVDGTIREGDPIDVAWSNAPGNRFDWIGIYRRGADPAVASSPVDLHRGHDRGLRGPGRNLGGAVPVPPGKYTAMLLVDDAYEAVATADFVIR